MQYRIANISPPTQDNYLHKYRGSLVQCARTARWMWVKYGMTSKVIRWDGSDAGKPMKALPLP